MQWEVHLGGGIWQKSGVGGGAGSKINERERHGKHHFVWSQNILTSISLLLVSEFPNQHFTPRKITIKIV